MRGRLRLLSSSGSTMRLEPAASSSSRACNTLTPQTYAAELLEPGAGVLEVHDVLGRPLELEQEAELPAGALLVDGLERPAGGLEPSSPGRALPPPPGERRGASATGGGGTIH